MSRARADQTGELVETTGAAGARSARAGELAPLERRLLESRLRPPRLSASSVGRDALLAKLQAPGHNVVVVSAPGGFGKTIALTQWADRDPRPFAWLQADGSLNDPVLFRAYLTAAPGEVVDVDPAVSQWLQLAAPPVMERAERRVLELLPTELSLKEIAARLVVSRDTVKSHVADLYRKLGAHSRSQAVARARELSLIP